MKSLFSIQGGRARLMLSHKALWSHTSPPIWPGFTCICVDLFFTTHLQNTDFNPVESCGLALPPPAPIRFSLSAAQLLFQSAEMFMPERSIMQEHCFSDVWSGGSLGMMNSKATPTEPRCHLMQQDVTRCFLLNFCFQYLRHAWALVFGHLLSADPSVQVRIKRLSVASSKFRRISKGALTLKFVRALISLSFFL